MSRDWGHPAIPLPLIILSLTLHAIHAYPGRSSILWSRPSAPLPLIILSSIPEPISPRPLARREPSPVPLRTFPRRGWTGPPAAEHSPRLASLPRLVPAHGFGSWLASVSRPGGPAAGPGRRTGPLPLSARSCCLGNAAPPSRDPSVGPDADHVTWRARWGPTPPTRSRGS